MLMPAWSGPILRGAFSDALRTGVCSQYHPTTLQGSFAGCPACDLLASSDERSARGTEMPRPFTLEPGIGPSGVLLPGRVFQFGMTLFGEAVNLFPFIHSAVQHMGRVGLVSTGQQPGRFRLREVWAENPFIGQRECLSRSQDVALRLPSIPITHRDVQGVAERQQSESLTLELLTPMRLVSGGQLVHTLTFEALLRRILRRIDQLARTGSGPGIDLPFGLLIESAFSIAARVDETRWVDLFSHSSRTTRSTPIGGLVGRITFEGEIRPYLPWLFWAEVCHVGKDTTKGNGWIQIISR